MKVVDFVTLPIRAGSTVNLMVDPGHHSAKGNTSGTNLPFLGSQISLFAECESHQVELFSLCSTVESSSLTSLVGSSSRCELVVSKITGHAKRSDYCQATSKMASRVWVCSSEGSPRRCVPRLSKGRDSVSVGEGLFLGAAQPGPPNGYPCGPLA